MGWFLFDCGLSLVFGFWVLGLFCWWFTGGVVGFGWVDCLDWFCYVFLLRYVGWVYV